MKTATTTVVAYMNPIGTLICGFECLSRHLDSLEINDCQGPWQGISQELVNAWAEGLRDDLQREVTETGGAVCDGIPPRLWLDMVAAVRCDVCGERKDR